MALVTHAALKAALAGGLVAEDVMSKIWDISKIPLPLSDMIGSDTHDNEYFEWTKDKLAAVDLTNAVVDGSDAGADNNKVGTRVGNRSQISDKVVSASERAMDGNVIGQSDAFAYQVMQRQQELYRDIEAISLANQASVADDGAATAGRTGGLDAWLTTNTSNGATGSNGGFQTGTKLVNVAVPGTARPLSETLIRDIAQSVWEQGGDPTTLMGRPVVIRALSAFMFSSSAQVATLMSDIREKRGSAIASGSVNVFVTDFGVVLEMVANRLQAPTSAGVSSLFCIDPGKLSHSFLSRVQTKDLGRKGLKKEGQMFADWGLRVGSEEAHGVIRAIDETAAVIA